MAGPEDALREIGWKKIEAECYCALVEYGEMTASEIAAHIRARQEKVYQPLKLLQSQGYVLIQDENPQRYRAQNPRYVISEEREGFQTDTDEILQNLQEAWEMVEEEMPQASENAWVSTGKEGMKTEQARIVEQSEKNLIAFDTRLQFSPPYVLDAIEEQAANEVEVSIVGLEAAEERLTRLGNSGVSSSLYTGDGLPKPSFYVSDGEMVLLNVSGGKATVVFNDKFFAEIMQMEYEELCEEAEPIP